MGKILSSVGVGSAKVDTMFPSETVYSGSDVDVTVEVEGGETDQQIDAMYFMFGGEGGSETYTVDKARVTQSFTIEAGERRTFDSTLNIPIDTPITQVGSEPVAGANVWLDTGLDIDWAVDPDDHDELTVKPGNRIGPLFEALSELGFSYRGIDYIETPQREIRFERPFLQKFEFETYSAPFAGDMEKLEIAPIPLEDELRVDLVVDRYREVTGKKDRAEKSGEQFVFSDMDVTQLRKNLQPLIRKHIDSNPNTMSSLDVMNL